MVNKNKIANLIVLGGLMCVVPAAFADCPQSTPLDPTTAACMSLVGAGNNIFAGVYVGPYAASINGSLTNTSVICDDYLDESYIPEFWTADIYQGSDSSALPYTRDATNTKQGSIGPSLSGLPLQEAYDEVGYLALQLLATTDATTIGEIHFALWSIFDPTALSDLNVAFGGSNLTVPNSNPTLTAAFNGAEYQLSLAVQAVRGVHGSDGDKDSNYSTYISQFTIYSPDQTQQVCPGSLGCSKNTPPPQEFLVKTPEAPFLALLGVDLSGLGAVIFLLGRRRTSRP